MKPRPTSAWESFVASARRGGPIDLIQWNVRWTGDRWQAEGNCWGEPVGEVAARTRTGIRVRTRIASRFRPLTRSWRRP